MAEKLTPQQRLAVENRGGRLLVSAAAGSGKTKVLVDRLLRYLTDPIDPANLDDFLIITYTKAAASELRAKIAAKLSERIAEQPGNRHLQQQMQRLYLTKISTIHSFCADILREYAYRLDISADFRVADENECMELQTQVLEQLLEEAYETAGDNPGFCAFVDSQGFGRDDRQVPQIILQVYNSARCHLNPQKWLEWCVDTADTSKYSDAGETVWGAYLIRNLQEYLDLQIQALDNCRILAENADLMEKPAALLADTVNQLKELRNCSSWDEIVKHRDIDYGRLTFSKKCPDLFLAEQIKAVRKYCKAGLERKLRAFQDCSEQVLSDLHQSSLAVSGLIQLVEKFDLMYGSRKKARRVLDFSDLEHKMLDLVLGKSRTALTSLALEIGERFREVMIDEYQDSNEVQDKIFRALTYRRQNCFMVGDIKQSIYQFRLADPDIFIDMYRTYKNAEDAAVGEGRKVLLSSNFRSSAGVISAVNDVFLNCMSEKVGGITYGDDELLREGIPHIPLPDPEVELYGISVTEDTYLEESSFVAKRISELLDGKHMIRQGDTLRPITPGDIVILLRSPGSVGGEFRYALEQRGIPCTTGSSVDLLQTEEVAILRAFLQVISNPLQDIPLIALLSSRVFCFNADDLAEIRSSNRKSSFYEALLQHGSPKCMEFVELLSTLRQEAKLYNLPQLLQRIFVRASIDSIFAAMPDGMQRQENLQQFCQIAAEYESSGRKDLTQFLEHLQILEEKGLIRSEGATESGSVTIMSIHKSKGLEFPVVFLCGLSRSFNQESTRAQVLCDKTLGLGLSIVDAVNRVRYPSVAKRAIAVKVQSDSISEELRVLYVAMTRPKDRLIMTYAVKNLESDLSDIAMRSSVTDQRLMTSDVLCPGEWVLQTAMKRTEAGEFFALSRNPGNSAVCDMPWLIRVLEGQVYNGADIVSGEEETPLTDDLVKKLAASLAFSYPCIDVTQAPSKLTATQLKGRFKDSEAAENAEHIEQIPRMFRKPNFISHEGHGKEYGNAVHAVMQYISYDACSSDANVACEILRLVREGRITPEQGKMADAGKIARMFCSPIGRKLRTAENVIREFKFTILDDSEKYIPNVSGEQILLQGVVDCALIESDGITVIDFKTDYVTDETLQSIVEKYKPQVRAYAEALARIYRKPVCRTLLYFFHLERFVDLNL